MTPRMTDYFKRAEAGFKPLFALEAAIKASPLEHGLLHLIKLRASQINACAYCIHMHTAEALKDGETPLRLHMLVAWRESPLYSPRERAALAWTEALTRLEQSGAPDADWQAMTEAFSEDERAWLSLAIGAINAWNRVQVGFRAPHPTDLPVAKPMPPDPGTEVFQAHRPRLLRLAYRMLGSHHDAEDVVQAAWLRWQRSERAAVQEPAAWLTRIVSRLCLDQMKSARARRETYPGTWLPEPLIEPEDDALRPDNLTLTLMMALERLSPLERAAFLLHDVFGQSMNEVAATIDRTPAATRQLASRARAHVQIDRPRYDMSREAAETLTRAFFEACKSGDAAALGAMLAEGATFQADGGGKVTSYPNVIAGVENLIRLFKGWSRKFGDRMEMVEPVMIDGLPGFVSRIDGHPQTTALQIEAGRITAIYITRNPDKLDGVIRH